MRIHRLFAPLPVPAPSADTDKEKNVLKIRLDKNCFIVYNGFTETVKGGIIMKSNLTELQYIKLAKETFARTLASIPFVSDVEIVDSDSKKEFGDFRATVNFTDSDIPQKFFVEVKSNGEKRFAELFMMKEKRETDACFLFVAPYISETTAEMLRSNGCSFMDLSGNCHILTRRIIIRIGGNPNLYKEVRSQKNYFSKSSSAASAVLRTMLNEPDRLWKVKELSEVTGKAIGTVSNVKAFLTQKDLIDEKPSAFRLKNVKELFCAWSGEYHKKDSIERQYYTLDTVPEAEAKISKWSLSHEKDAFLSGFSAAARYAPTVRYNKINVYVEEKSVFEFVKDLSLEPVRSGGNIIITVPHDETPGMFRRVVDSSVVASPAQTIIDLLGMPNRGEEAADAIILKKYGG